MNLPERSAKNKGIAMFMVVILGFTLGVIVQARWNFIKLKNSKTV